MCVWYAHDCTYTNTDIIYIYKHMIFKRTATGVDNGDLKCISFALKIQGIIFYFSNFCASISSSDFLQKKKNWFREKNES